MLIQLFNCNLEEIQIKFSVYRDRLDLSLFMKSYYHESFIVIIITVLIKEDS